MYFKPGHAADVLEQFASDPRGKQILDTCIEKGRSNNCNYPVSCPNCTAGIFATDAKCATCKIDLRYCCKVRLSH